MVAVNKASDIRNVPNDVLKDLKDVLARATLQLEGGAVLRPQVEAERILEHATGLSRVELYLTHERVLAADELELVEITIKERLTGKPLQYILGRQQFRHLDLVCREGVLIPRPETELLVEAALFELRKYGCPRTVVDIGAGTGAIAVSIAYEYEQATVYAADVSEEALNLTGENARANGVEGRVHAVVSDVFSGLDDVKGQVDIVVSNPPYIPRGELATLQREVQFEPRAALDGGEDGLDFYREIVQQSPGFLKPAGALLFEIEIGQSSAITALLKDAGCFTDIEVLKDYQGIDRIITARKVM